MSIATPTTFVRALGFLACIGALTFTVGIGVAGAMYPGYSHIDQMISELGGPDATHPEIQNLNFILFGITIVGLAVAISLRSGAVSIATVLFACLGIFGTTTEGIIHCDSGCLGKTSEGMAHNMSGLFGFVAGVAALLILARRWRNDPMWSAYARFTRICGLASLGGLLFFIGTGAAKATSIDGLAQRTFAVPLLVWAAVMGWRLSSRSDAGASGR